MKLKIALGVVVCVVLLYFSYVGLGSSTDKVIIATNADEEAIAAMDKALKENGYEDEYIIQPNSTAELGGKIIAEGRHLEADVVTQATYYLKSAQDENDMFVPIDSKMNQETIDAYPNYVTPLLGNTGSLFVNKKALKERGLEEPKSIKDLTKPEYKNQISMPNVMQSSTGWLVLQSIYSEYGEKEGKKVIQKLLENVGPHLEDGGSGPLQKVKSGEVAIGVGLRAQAIGEEQSGNIIKHIDPIEGNYSLVEAASVVKKGGEKEKKAKEMVKTIQAHGREDLKNLYPAELYDGEKVPKSQQPLYPKKWGSDLTVELLERHQEIFSEAKKDAEEN